MILNTQGLFEWLRERSWKKKFADLAFLILFIVLGLTAYLGVHALFEHKLSYATTVTSGTIIAEQLSTVRHKTDSDAVVFYRYHNGTTGVNGFSFIKKSAQSVSRNHSFMYDVTLEQDIPVTSDLEQLKSHIDGECTYVNVTHKLQTFPLLAKNNVKSYATCPVVDYNGLLIGYVMIVYHNTIDFNEVSVEDVLRVASVQIGLT